MRTLDEVIAFRATYALLPSGAAPAGSTERRLARWLTYQRDRNELNDEQLAALSRLPGWDLPNRDEQWEARLERALEFIANAGRVPRRRANDPYERSLGVWWARQRQRAVRQCMPYHWLVLWRRAEAVAGRAPASENQRDAAS